VSCYVAVYVASKLKLSVSSCLSLIWKICKYTCQHMVIMRFVSWSGDGIEKCVCGGGRHLHGQLLPDVSKALLSRAQK
jgi:hypothetical protein